MGKKKAEPIKWLVNTPLRIEKFEKRIIENCSVVINSSVEVYGKLVFRNCSIEYVSGGIVVYGSIKIQKCKIDEQPSFLQIADHGEYLFDLLYFDDPALYKRTEGRYLSWINDPNIECWLEDAILTSVAEYYEIEKKWICGAKTTGMTDEEREIAREAVWISIWLRKKILQISTYKISHQLSYPTYLAADVWQYIQQKLDKGDEKLWKRIAEIGAIIGRKLYERDVADEKDYPYRD